MAPPGFPTDPSATVLEFLRVPGQPVGTLGGLAAGGTAAAGYISETGELLNLAADDPATKALTAVTPDGEPHTITAGSLGDYRALAVATSRRCAPCSRCPSPR